MGGNKIMIGDMILANEVLSTSNSQVVLNGPNNVFPVLNTPAFVSFGVAIVVSGIDLTTDHKLVIEFSELEDDTKKNLVFNEIIPGNPNQLDPNPTLSANLSLRNIRVNNLGYHNVTLKVDDEKLTTSTINIVKVN